MLTEKVDVFVIRSRFQGIDLDGVRGPILKKKPKGFLGKFSHHQSLHELRAANPLLPALGHLSVNSVDTGLRILRTHLNVHQSSFVALISHQFSLTNITPTNRASPARAPWRGRCDR